MPLISTEDLTGILYPEILDELTRGDDTTIQHAIAAAEREAKMYLGRYDLEQLFGDGHSSPAVDDEHLKRMVMHIACWHLIQLSGIAGDYTRFRTAYKDTLETLRLIMTGQAQPDGWPLTTNITDIPPGNSISWNSNKQRSNFY